MIDTLFDARTDLESLKLYIMLQFFYSSTCFLLSVLPLHSVGKESITYFYALCTPPESPSMYYNNSSV
jgi:hypothetical protein